MFRSLRLMNVLVLLVLLALVSLSLTLLLGWLWPQTDLILTMRSGPDCVAFIFQERSEYEAWRAAVALINSEHDEDYARGRAARIDAATKLRTSVVEANRAWRIGPGTRLRVLSDQHFGQEVEILNGPLRGKRGWRLHMPACLVPPGAWSRLRSLRSYSFSPMSGD